MKQKLVALIILVLISVLPTFQSASAGDKRFPKKVEVLDGSSPEGFAIGRGTTAYNGSPDGSIYKVSLRTGQGEILVPVQDPDDCLKLGMRFDRRTDYLFVAGCIYGTAQVFEADTGALIMEYQLDSSGLSLINDLAITGHAVYFTDSAQAFIYRLPLYKNGRPPLDPGAATAIPLTGDFELGDVTQCCAGNGIVATPNGKTLIIGHSNAAQLYRVDPTTGHADAISVDPPLSGFLDGIVMRGHTLYILTPGFDPATDPDTIQVVQLDKDMLAGKLVQKITDPDLDGVASGAFFGDHLYVNNARYFTEFPPPADTEYWLTKLKPQRVKDDGIVSAVNKAPVVSDGTTAGRVTDFVINLDTTLDPSTNGRTLLQGKTIRITLPASFQNTKNYMFGGCGPPLFGKPCNTAVLLQGWPQHPVGPPPEKYTFDYEEDTNTLVFTAKVDLTPAAPLEPGIKQMHLLLFGFTNPHPGDYRFKVEAETGPGGTMETGWAKIHIIPKSRPSINVTSTGDDNPTTLNTIYQSATVGNAVPLNYNFLLWDREDKAFVGVDIADKGGNGKYVFKKDNKVVGHVSIDSPKGAVGQMLMSFGESVAVAPPTIGGPETTARWVGKFVAGSEPGRYTVTAKLNGGNKVEMFIDVTN